MMKIFGLIDPAYLNLKNAVRGTLAVVVAFTLCSRLSLLMGFMGGMLALLSSILVSDLYRRPQIITNLVMIPVSLVSLIFAIVLSDHHDSQLIVFSLFTFTAIYIRKFGIRWLALGIISFMSYFLPLFFPLKTEQLPLICLTVLISILCSFLFRFYILPDKPEIVLRNYIRTWNRLYLDLAQMVKDGKRPSLVRLNELTLLIEGHCNNYDPHKMHSRTEALQMALFEREMDLQFHPQVESNPIVIDELTKNEIIKEIQVGSIKNESSPKSLNSTTKLAIQTTIAVSLASYSGILLSPERWYWAPMAAFVTLTGTSRGETLLRATTRILGTIIGLVIGLLLAPAMSGHSSTEWALVVLCIFMGIFSTKFTFGFWSASWFTFMLTVFLNLMGQFTNQVLILRFEETLLGAVIGTIVSALILPTSTMDAVKTAVKKTLQSQASVLSFLPLKTADQKDKREMIKAIRKMDQEYSSLRLIAKPYTEGYSLIKRKKMVTLIHHTTFLNHYVKQLVTMKDAPSPDTETNIQKTREKLLNVAENLDSYLENEQLLSELGNINRPLPGDDF